MNQRRVLFPLMAVLLSSLAGWAYHGLFGVGGSSTVSIVHGIFIGTPILAYERGMLLHRFRERVRRSATPLFMLATFGVFITAFIGGNAVAALVLWMTGIAKPSLARAATLAPSGLPFSMIAAAFVIAGFRIRDLLGPGTFASLLVGRYHKPISEERLFLFLDLVGSTRFADRHGALRTQEFLGAVFEALAAPVRQHRGSIDDYVGDMAIVTWPLTRGARDAAAVRCLFDFVDTIDRNGEVWQRDFGVVPRFRAALHGGSVVTAEIGLERHKITYFGEVVNATSRLESLTRSLDLPFLISRELLSRIPRLPAGVVAESIGDRALRGLAEPLGVASLRRTDAARPQGTWPPRPESI